MRTHVHTWWHAYSQEAVAGELAVVPPLLGSSQTLLNRDHWAVYYEVPTFAVLLPRCLPSANAEVSMAGVSWKARVSFGCVIRTALAHAMRRGDRGSRTAELLLAGHAESGGRRHRAQAAWRRGGAATGRLLHRARPLRRHNEPRRHQGTATQ